MTSGTTNKGNKRYAQIVIATEAMPKKPKEQVPIITFNQSDLEVSVVL